MLIESGGFLFFTIFSILALIVAYSVKHSLLWTLLCIPGLFFLYFLLSMVSAFLSGSWLDKDQPRFVTRSVFLVASMPLRHVAFEAYNENCFGYGVLFFFISLLGAFMVKSSRQVHPGMSVSDVQKIMGPQEGYRKVGDDEIYSYYNKMMSGWSWDRADYHYVFENGVLVQYGAGEIRQNKVNGAVFIVPLK